MIEELKKYKIGEKNQAVKGDLKIKLDDYYYKHSDVSSGALKKRDGFIKNLENETLFRDEKDYNAAQIKKQKVVKQTIKYTMIRKLLNKIKNQIFIQY